MCYELVVLAKARITIPVAIFRVRDCNRPQTSTLMWN